MKYSDCNIHCVVGRKDISKEGDCPDTCPLVVLHKRVDEHWDALESEIDELKKGEADLKAEVEGLK